MSSEGAPGVSFHQLSAGGDVGALFDAKDWAQTSLGARAQWQRSLTNHLSMIFELPTAAIIFWGPEQVQLYNDGYAVIMGPRHPRHLGSTFRACWPEAYDGIYPWMRRVLDSGETVQVTRTLVPLTRFGYTDESYFTFSFSPLRDDDGRIAGILQLVTEMTSVVLAERRTVALRELSNVAAVARTGQEATRLAAECIARHASDIPFSLLYVADADRSRLRLTESTGFPSGKSGPPSELEVAQAAASSALPEVVHAFREREVTAIEGLVARLARTDPSLAQLPSGPWPETSKHALAIPIAAADQQSVVAVLVLATSPRLALDDSYRDFLQLVAAQLATVMAAARAYDEERRRADAMATPVLHVDERTLLAPLIGEVDDARAMKLSAVLLRAVKARRARHVVIDLTGVQSTDAGAAARLLRVAASARLMGAAVILSGLQDVVAKELVANGEQLKDITVTQDLASALLAARAAQRQPSSLHR